MSDQARINRRHFLTSTLATSAAQAGAARAAPAWAQAPAVLRSVEQITVLQLDEVASLDPLADFTNPGLQMHAHILEPLIDFTGPDFKMTPKLAVSWDNPTPTRWRFKLRPNVTWHDGEPFTADDVVFNALEYWKPISGGVSLSALSAAEALDKHTVALKFNAPVPEFFLKSVLAGK